MYPLIDTAMYVHMFEVMDSVFTYNNDRHVYLYEAHITCESTGLSIIL